MFISQCALIEILIIKNQLLKLLAASKATSGILSRGYILLSQPWGVKWSFLSGLRGGLYIERSD